MKRGSRLQNYPHLLELSYQVANRLFAFFDPLIARLGYRRAERWLRPAEELSKRVLFDCRMCGQCVLHSTGMTCPMTCPKQLRNGPCGGVRSNGHCEVVPELKCIWVMAFERSKEMPAFGREMMHLQPPVSYQLEGSSAWINMLTGEYDQLPAGWEEVSPRPVIKIEEIEAWKPTLSQTAA